MPLILDESQFEDWMRGMRGTLDQAVEMMKPYAGAIEAWEVGAEVGNVKNNRSLGDRMATIRKYERDIDLLLAEEFVVSPGFAKWFVSRTKFAGRPYETVEVSVSRSDVSGETDLEVRFVEAAADAFALLIEDKIGARLQEDQLGRYHRRAEAAMQRGEYSRYEIVLCSPLNYYHEQPIAQDFPCFISYEDIADQMLAAIDAAIPNDDRRKRYRANFLRTAATKSINKWERTDDPITNQFWSNAHELAVRYFPILEMKEPHFTKGTIWISLRPSCLPTQPKRVSIELKGKTGHVDLSFADTMAAAFHGQIKDHLGKLTIHPAGKAAVIRIKIVPFSISEGADIGLAKVRSAFVAAEELVQFYKDNQALLDLAAARSTREND
jgi:hypothetical protein